MVGDRDTNGSNHPIYSSSSVLGEMDLAKLLLDLSKQIWQTAIGSPQTGSCQQALRVMETVVTVSLCIHDSGKIGVLLKPVVGVLLCMYNRMDVLTTDIRCNYSMI